jgi:hypothetical protein
LPGPGLDLHHDLHIAPQRIEKPEEPIHREPLQVTANQVGDAGLIDAQQLARLPSGQTAILDDADD